MRAALEAKYGDPTVCRLDFKPIVKTSVTDLESAQKLMDFVAQLEEDDDVQRVITNADIPEEILKQL